MTPVEIEKARWRLAEKRKAAVAKVAEAKARLKTWRDAVEIVPEGKAREKAQDGIQRAEEALLKALEAIPALRAEHEALMAAEIANHADGRRLAGYQRTITELNTMGGNG